MGERTELVDKLRGYLGNEFRVEVTDGRVIVGIFSCIDDGKNMVLKECVEVQHLKIPNTGTHGSSGNGGKWVILILVWCRWENNFG